jgi:hypothetical protein
MNKLKRCSFNDATNQYRIEGYLHKCEELGHAACAKNLGTTSLFYSLRLLSAVEE